MKLTLSLTHRCNLACRYCYAGRAATADMSLATAERCIDAAMEVLPAGKGLELGLFGGEPLLRMDLIQDITDYARRQADARETPLRIGITTNGTLASPAVLDLLAELDIGLCFSIDGPADVHDRNRVRPDGSGSFAAAATHLEQALTRFDRVEVNAVVGPDSLTEVPRTLRFFTDLGVRIIHLSPNIMANWTPGDCARLEAIYGQVAEQYVDCYRQGVEVAVNLIDAKAILFAKGGYAACDRCAMGLGEWGVAPSGNLYPCERFIGDDEDSPFRLGNIHTGIDPVRQAALQLKRGNHRPECLACKEARYCMNWCGCTNHFMSGQTDIPAPALCAMERAAIRAARHAFTSLIESDNDLFIDHLFGYLSLEGHGRQRPAVQRP